MFISKSSAHNETFRLPLSQQVQLGIIGLLPSQLPIITRSAMYILSKPQYDSGTEPERPLPITSTISKRSHRMGETYPRAFHCTLRADTHPIAYCAQTILECHRLDRSGIHLESLSTKASVSKLRSEELYARFSQ